MGNDGKNAAGCEACSTGCPRNRRGAFPVGVGEEHLRAPGCTACACPGRARRHGASHAPANRDQGDPAVGTAAPRQKGAHRPCGRSRAALSRGGCPDGQATRMRTLPKMRAIPTAADRDNGSWRKKIPRQAAERGLREAEGRGGGGGRHLEPGEGEGKGDGRGHDPEMQGHERAHGRRQPRRPGRSRRRAAYTARSGGTGPSTDPGAAFWASGLLNTK